MAVSLDDKLLGEKTHYYCSSSSEDEAEQENLTGGPEKEPPMTDFKEYATNVTFYFIKYQSNISLIDNLNFNSMM